MSQPESAAQAAPGEPRFFPEFCFAAPEEVDEFDHLIHSYFKRFQPEGAVQKTVFQNLIHAAWELVRCRRMEAALCASFRSYTDLLSDDNAQRKMDWVARRKGQFERSFNRSLKEIRALKAEELRHQPTQPLPAQTSHEQLKAMAARIPFQKKTKISERSQPEPAHSSALYDPEQDYASQTPPDPGDTETRDAA